MSTSLAISALYLLASLATFAAGQTTADLRDVKKIYVGSLGHKRSAESLRKDLISQLKKSSVVAVVQSPSEADAVLSGTGELWVRGYYSLNPRSGIIPQNGTPVYGGSLSVELDGRDSDPLWSYLATPRFDSANIPKDIGKQLCRELVRQLTQALREAAHRKPEPVRP